MSEVEKIELVWRKHSQLDYGVPSDLDAQFETSLAILGRKYLKTY